MFNRWAEQFLAFAANHGLECRAVRYSSGWLETALIAGRLCFTKSATYNHAAREYFQGVDPKKLDERGDFVVLCGGAGQQLRDIFVIRWHEFFALLAQGEPVNTYKDREYLQYKLHVRDRDGGWHLSVQGGSNPTLDVTSCRLAPDEALAIFASST